MKKIRFSFIAIAAIVSLSSCKKEDDKTKTELLTAGTWKMVSDQEKIGTGQWVETIADYDACELDNYYAFKTNQTVEFNVGAIKCDPLENQSETGTWMFMNGETTLHIESDEVNIDELSASTLMFTITESFGGVTYYSKFTFKH